MNNSSQRQKIQDIINALLADKHAKQPEVQQVITYLQNMLESDVHHIVRKMHVPEAYVITALSLLHYFSVIVKSIHPHIKATYTTTQEGHSIKLVIATSRKDRPILETLLDHYSLVLLKRAPLNTLTEDTKVLMALKQQLDLSALSIKITHDLSAQDDLEQMTDISSLAEDITSVHQSVGRGISSMEALQDIIHHLLSKQQQSTSEALQYLRSKLHSDIGKSDEAPIKEALKTVQEHEPDAFEEMREIINKGSISGAAGDLLYSWIASLSSLMPK